MNAWWRWALALSLIFAAIGCTNLPAVGGPVVVAGTSGAGQLQLPSGETYWILPNQLRFTGQAKFLWPDGRWYQGSWSAGKPHGQGELQLPSGEHYLGNFEYGDRHGFGTQTSNAGTYKGQWYKDAAEGQGQFQANNGDRYQGEYLLGQRQGYGELNAADGSVYRGDWQQDQYHGQGEFITLDGQVYRGAWRSGQRSGYGEQHDALGNRYAGTWVDGKRQGFGKLMRADKSRYEGEWEKDQRHGSGTEHFAAGGWHNGEWSHNQALGSGTRQTRTGIKLLGIFTGDRVSSGLLELPSGAEFAGPLFRKQMREVTKPLLDWTQTQAEAGEPSAQWLLAGFYQRFDKPKPNPELALRWYQAAASKLADAQYRAGQLLLDESPVAAVRYLKQAATQGHMQAQRQLGALFHSGKAVSPNATTAIQWYSLAAEQGSLRAKTQLAWLLATSQEAHARDPQRALDLIEVTAKATGTWILLDTLAATYAALGDFSSAINAEQAALEALQNSKEVQPNQLASMQARLALYQTNKPFVEVVYAGD